ncbi:MAG: DUF5004 domain-containing protein, partial [Mucilaginibacter sp.]
NKLPFLVADNGTFKLDDDQYAFAITFTPEGGAAKTSSFGYPNVNGIRELGIQFSTTGCVQNKYVYTFQKVN